jgi:4-alpha-glucanotransferase
VTEAGAADPLPERASGVLLHPTSLPGPGGAGNLGADARRFADWLAAAGFRYWQMLPIGPVDAWGSPYQSASAFAGNARLLAPECGPRAAPNAEDAAAFDAFCAQQAHWLDDYALFRTLRAHLPGSAWTAWPEPLRRREPAALERARRRWRTTYRAVQWTQYRFQRQWRALRDYAAARGVRLIGDLPLLVAHDSADVWSQPEFFQLDARGEPLVVAGVPPDYFSATGQWWGNPLYRWSALAADGYRWWRRRLARLLELFDLVRLDHFRGLEACWEIPADAVTAAEGRWVPGPGAALLDALAADHARLPIIAEDLGVITPEVEALRDRYALPGMKVLQFAFDSDDTNPYLPHHHRHNCVVYTGTHDNDTTLGWYRSLTDERRQRVRTYLDCTDAAMPWPLIDAALASIARLAVIPLQDLLGLDGTRRMNTPGTTGGNNWRFRFAWDEIPVTLAARLHARNAAHRR